MQAGASIRTNHSGLNLSHTWHHAQPLENASQFQISIPTLLGRLPMPLGLPSKVPTSSTHYPSFPPQSQDTIHTHDTRIESSGLRNDTHTRETHIRIATPCPTAPTAESPSRLARALPRPAAQNNAMVSSWRNDHTERRHRPRGRHATKILSYATHGPNGITAWLRGLNSRILEATHVVGKNSSSTSCLAWEPVAPRSQTLALVREASSKCNRLGEKYSTAGYVRAPMRL